MGSKCAPKGSVNSVRSVREKTPHCEYPTIFLSQKITEEQNTQGFRKVMAPPPTPPPEGRGVITEIPL